MNCATCGTVLTNGGPCTICDPWLTPAEVAAPARTAAAAVPSARTPPPTPSPAAGSQRRPASIPANWKRVIAKSPAAYVDMGGAFRTSIVITLLHVAALALVGLVDFALTNNGSLDYESTLLLSILPLIVIRLVARTTTGWMGAAISNVKLRPDIGVDWMFRLRSMRRMIAYNGGYAVAFVFFILIRISQPTSPDSQGHTWMDITGTVYLLGAAFQLLLFATLGRRSYKTVCARLSTPPPWAVNMPMPQEAIVDIRRVDS